MPLPRLRRPGREAIWSAAPKSTWIIIGKRRRLLSGELRLLELARKRRVVLGVAAVIAALGAAAFAFVAFRSRLPFYEPPRRAAKVLKSRA